ncbi:NAD(+) synthetase, partial [bacterium]
MFNPERFVPIAVEFIKEKVKELERDGAVLGISGGVDSAVVASLAKKALGKRVLGLILPERDSSPESVEHAKLVAETFGIKTETFNLSPLLETIGAYSLVPDVLHRKRKNAEKVIKISYSILPPFLKPFSRGLLGVKEKLLRGPTAYYRIKHRLRMVILYFYAEKLNYAVLGTTNRTEELTGFFVKYGDSATDIAPIACLYKTEVFELAKLLQMPKEIITKKPSAGLWRGQSDEKELGMSYEKIDEILKLLEKHAKEDVLNKIPE